MLDSGVIDYAIDNERKYALFSIIDSRIKGEVEVLNSCSMKGAAVKMRAFLRDNGFDVVHIDNERLQNYDETIIVLRNPEWEGAQALATTLKTKNVLILQNKNATVDAVVHTGRDFQQIIEPDQGEQNDSNKTIRMNG